MTQASSVHLLRLELGKANAMDDRLLAELSSGLEQAAQSGARAVVVTGYEKYFSAGLNLSGLPETREGMIDFVERFEQAMALLFGFPLPVVAAVNGHAVAGGCVLACACDLRIGGEGDYRIGLSELELGVPFPLAALEVVRSAIAPGWQAELIFGARLVGPNEAREAGILQAVVPAEELLERAMAQAERLGERPQPAYRLTKASLRRESLAQMEVNAQEIREGFVESWFSEEVKKRREALLRR